MKLRIRRLTEKEVEQAAYDGTTVLIVGEPEYYSGDFFLYAKLNSDSQSAAILEYSDDSNNWNPVEIV